MPEYEISYRIFLDSEPIKGFIVIGKNKKEAYRDQFEDQWPLFFPNQPLSARRRIKLQEEERTFIGF